MEKDRKTTAAQRKATLKYLEGFEEVRARVPKGEKDSIKSHAESQGESMNSFVVRAITETIERDNAVAHIQLPVEQTKSFSFSEAMGLPKSEGEKP